MATRILCLIIDAEPVASWQETYAVHRAAWHRCLDLSPEVRGAFVYSDPSLACDWVQSERRFAVRGEERAGTILDKTVAAIRVLLCEHDYVIRTNVSSLWDFPALQAAALPKKDLYAGHLVDGTYVTGAGMVLSRDVAEKLVGANYDAAHSEWDDIAIWQALSAQGVVARHREMFIYDYDRGLEQVELGRYLHYRLREYGDPERKREREVTRYLADELCKKERHR